MAGYSDGEALVLARLRAIAGNVWTADNSSRGNWKILDSGKSDHYAILKQGPHTSIGRTIQTFADRWTTVIEIWVAYTQDGISYTNMLSYGDAIREQFKKYRLLGDTGGTIADARYARSDQVEEMWTRGGGPRWLRQNFYIEWDEESTVEYAE